MVDHHCLATGGAAEERSELGRTEPAGVGTAFPFELQVGEVGVVVLGSAGREGGDLGAVSAGDAPCVHLPFDAVSSLAEPVEHPRRDALEFGAARHDRTPPDTELLRESVT